MSYKSLKKEDQIEIGVDSEDMNGWEEKIFSAMHRNGIDPSRKSYQRIEDYLNLVQKWSSRINISGYSDRQELLEEYVIDSMRLVKYIKGDLLVDIGSGAGVPGLVLAILCDGLRVVLTEKKQKKLSFLKRAVTGLKIHDRVEVMDANRNLDIPKGDTVTLRAVSDLAGSMALAGERMEEGSRVIMPRGIQDLEEALELGMMVETYPWGEHGKRRMVVIYQHGIQNIG